MEPTETDADQPLVPITDALAELSISRSTLENWIRAGRIKPYRKVGEKARFFRRADLDALLEPQPYTAPTP